MFLLMSYHVTWKPVTIWHSLQLSSHSPSPTFPFMLPAFTSGNHSVCNLGLVVSKTVSQTCNYKLRFGLSKLYIRVPCKCCVVFSLICISVICFFSFWQCHASIVCCICKECWAFPDSLPGNIQILTAAFSFPCYYLCVLTEKLWVLITVMSFWFT